MKDVFVRHRETEEEFKVTATFWLDTGVWSASNNSSLIRCHRLRSSKDYRVIHIAETLFERDYKQVKR